MEILLVIGGLALLILALRPKAQRTAIAQSPAVAANASTCIQSGRILPPSFGIATDLPQNVCAPVASSVPLVAPAVADSITNGVDQFQASGGTTPIASGGDILVSSFTGSDGIVQYIYRRPNGNTYTTTIKNA